MVSDETSPGSTGARVISPGPPFEVKVLANSVSPPNTVRVSAPRRPPFIPVSMAMLALMLTIAPASACTDSSGARETMASE